MYIFKISIFLSPTYMRIVPFHCSQSDIKKQMSTWIKIFIYVAIYVYISSLTRFPLYPISSASDIISVRWRSVDAAIMRIAREQENSLYLHPPSLALSFLRATSDFSSMRYASADFIDVVAELAISRNDPGSCSHPTAPRGRRSNDVLTQSAASWGLSR